MLIFLCRQAGIIELEGAGGLEPYSNIFYTSTIW
jgi:hypothetical protein